MTTDYNEIAEEYKASKLAPWRIYSEQYSLFRWLGDLNGKSVFDLACGEGHYTRQLARRGARPLVGVDLSEEMVRLGREQEANDPLGIEYVVGNVEGLDLGRTFDVVTAVYLLNYAQSGEQLLRMCQSIARHLRPGGRFVTVNGNSDFAPRRGPLLAKYQLIRHSPEELEEGTPLEWTFLLDGGQSVTIENYYLSRQTHEWAFRTAGLSNLRWHRAELDPAREQSDGREFWADYLADPPLVVLSAERPE